MSMGLRKDLNGKPEIALVSPAAAIAGGEFQIRGKGFTKPEWPRVTIGDVLAQLTIGSDSLVIAKVRVPAVVAGISLLTSLGP